MNENTEPGPTELVWTPTIDALWPFDRWLSPWWNEASVSFTPSPSSRRWDLPRFRTEILEHPDAYEVVVELPGIPKERIEISVQGTRLKIRAEDSVASSESAPDGARPPRARRLYERTFELPQPTTVSSVQARAENGILTVRIAKPSPIPEEKVPLA